MATFPPPMTTTCFPWKSGRSPSPICRSSSTAEMTPWLSSPGMPVRLSVWAPMEMYRQSYCFFSSWKEISFPTSASVWTLIPRERMDAISASSSSRGKR